VLLVLEEVLFPSELILSEELFEFESL
jgi:hypothetical protein